ncbi:KR domain-containing protein, partial [Bradyrhizobium sp. Leaf401]|uniref:KR domain-containing protein n=1 Tax=Bradyrhizobium sp. Leaf401 TaxID=2876564 RepID=UPI001E62B33C
MQSFSRAAGQSNYASGCNFADAFAHHLARSLGCPVKIMNWGYWGTVGVVASEPYRARMAQLGIGSIEVEEGMAALEALLCGPLDQLAFVKTTRPLDIATTTEQLCVYPAQIGSSLARLAELQGSFAEPAQLEDRQLREGIDELLCRLLWAQLQGLKLRDREQAGVETIRVRLGVPEHYGRWLEESLRILVGRRYLEKIGELYSAIKPPEDVNEVWRDWAARKADWLGHPGLQAHAALLEQTLQFLPDIVTGVRRATEVVFPNGSLGLVEGIYKNHPIADYFNELVSEGVVSFVQERLRQDATARIRILEVGAGTGGTSAR